MFLVGVFVECVQSVLGAYPQVIGVFGGDVADATEHFCVVDVYIVVIADVEELVFATHPYTAISRVSVHGLYVLLRGHERWLHETSFARGFVDNVYACSVSANEQCAGFHFA